MTFLSWTFFARMQTIRPKMCITMLYGSCSFLLGFPFSAESGGTARLHLHECTMRTACSQKGDIRTGNQVAETNWDGKSKLSLPLSAATFSILFWQIQKDFCFHQKFLQKKNHFQARTLRFLPFCWVMTDLTEALSIGGVGEPRKYKLKCNYTSFPWNTVNPCKSCSVSSRVRGGGEQ